MSFEPTKQQLARFPQLDVPCPRCGATVGRLCMSHEGTRPRNNDVHQDRRAAWAEAAICPDHRGGCDPDDHVDPPTVDGEVI